MNALLTLLLQLGPRDWSAWCSVGRDECWVRNLLPVLLDPGHTAAGALLPTLPAPLPVQPLPPQQEFTKPQREQQTVGRDFSYSGSVP